MLFFVNLFRLNGKASLTSDLALLHQGLWPSHCSSIARKSLKLASLAA